MRKKFYSVLLLTLSCTLIFSGCRRKPIETEKETETETETQTETESETAKQTEKETEKETTKQTEKKTTVAAQTQTTVTAQTNAVQTETQQTEAPSSSQCPYCGNWFYTTVGEDGTSDYSRHIAAEEADAEDISAYDESTYSTGTDGVTYAQCQYCFQWFSTVPDESGYSPYNQHVAQESAYAAQMGYDAEYVQCPYCGNWVTSSEYDVHIANGW